MKTFCASRRYVIGWLVVAMAGIGQAPRLYGDADPPCPTCAPHATAAQDFPTLELPPHAAPEGASQAPHMEMPIEACPEDVTAPMVRLRTRVAACAEVGKELEYRIK